MLDIPKFGKTKQAKDLCWTTDHEKRFINRLGSLSEAGRKFSKAYLLEQYKKSFVKRGDWGGIDSDDILAYLASRTSVE